MSNETQCRECGAWMPGDSYLLCQDCEDKQFDQNMEKLNRSLRAGRLLDRWRKIQLQLFTPNLAPARRQRIQSILDRLIERYNALTPWNKINLGGAQ